MRSLVLIGQGSHTETQATRSVYQLAELLRQQALFHDVVEAFWKEEPSLRQVLRVTATTDVTLLPLFQWSGYITETVIPRELGLGHQGPVPPAGIARVMGGKTLRYLPPLSADSPLKTVLNVTQQALSLDAFSGDIDRAHLAAWTAFIAQARLGLRVGEALITPHGALFDVRHTLDEGRPSTELTTYVTPEGLREAVTQDDAGRHRPVRTFRTLPRRWRGVFSEDDLPLAMHSLYPAAVEEAHACASYNLRSTPWPTTARRQTGRDAQVKNAPPALVEKVARQVCAGCLRRRLWAGEALHHTFLSGVPGGLACAEACTYLLAQVREAVGQELAVSEESEALQGES